jgi:hypothetical protein
MHGLRPQPAALGCGSAQQPALAECPAALTAPSNPVPAWSNPRPASPPPPQKKTQRGPPPTPSTSRTGACTPLSSTTPPGSTPLWLLASRARSPTPPTASAARWAGGLESVVPGKGRAVALSRQAPAGPARQPSVRLAARLPLLIASCFPSSPSVVPVRPAGREEGHPVQPADRLHAARGGLRRRADRRRRDRPRHGWVGGGGVEGGWAASGDAIKPGCCMYWPGGCCQSRHPLLRRQTLPLLCHVCSE